MGGRRGGGGCGGAWRARVGRPRALPHPRAERRTSEARAGPALRHDRAEARARGAARRPRAGCGGAAHAPPRRARAKNSCPRRTASSQFRGRSLSSYSTYSGTCAAGARRAGRGRRGAAREGGLSRRRRHAQGSERPCSARFPSDRRHAPPNALDSNIARIPLGQHLRRQRGTIGAAEQESGRSYAADRRALAAASWRRRRRRRCGAGAASASCFFFLSARHSSLVYLRIFPAVRLGHIPHRYNSMSAFDYPVSASLN